VYVGAYAIDDDPSIFKLVIASIVDRESFEKQFLQLDSATRDHLTIRLDYYQVNFSVIRQYRASPSLTVVDNYSNIIVTKTDIQRWLGLIWDFSIHKYTAKVDKSSLMEIIIGFAPSKIFDVSESNCKSCGWYLFLNNGTLYSQNGNSGRAYSSGWKEGDTITCIYNASTGEISFEKNGVSLGVAFTDVNGEDIAPAVEFYRNADSITLTID
jgi:SPRY domain